MDPLAGRCRGRGPGGLRALLAAPARASRRSPGPAHRFDPAGGPRSGAPERSPAGPRAARRQRIGRNRHLLCPLPGEGDERRQEIEVALQRLPDEQREVLVLKIWQELTFEQIGEVLGISPNTAASRYRYALTALRAQLESLCHG
ncbi:MAG: sigma-70 family RNA polymerase sigma factor [Lacunisphaera sp.]